MYRLRAFGGISVEHRDAPEPLVTGKRPLALLALLAAAAPGAIARDKILAYLWPELDEARGRNVLNQTLFAIRQALGSEAILGRPDLRLNPELVATDVLELNVARDANDHHRVATLFSGPFLDGFYLSDAPEFERWVEETRRRFARNAVAALHELAAAAEASGDLRAAATWLWRITEIDPMDSAAAYGLVRVLAGAGERARAVQFARRHENLLRQEIGTGVDKALADLVQQVLQGGREIPDGREAAVAASDRRPVASAPPLRARTRWRRSLASVTGISAVAFVIGYQLWPSPSEPAPSARTATVVAVLPFEVRGSPDAHYLREGLPELVGRGINGAGNLRVVDIHAMHRAVTADSGADTDPMRAARIAETLRADRFIVGNVVATMSSLRISASVFERGRQVKLVASGSVDGSPSDLLALVDRLTTRLLVEQESQGRLQSTDVGQLSTYSLRALRHFVDGQAHRRSGRYSAAVEAFQQAVRDDSTFAIAWYALSNAADWASRSDLVMPAARMAAQFSERLTEHDRLLARAHLAWREDRVEDAARLYRILLNGYPDDAESWYQLGEVLYHGNSRRGRSFAEARGAFERVRSLTPDDRESLMHLVRIAARTGSPRDLNSLTRVALEEASASEARELRALHAYARQDVAAQRAVLREFASADGATLGVAAWRVGLYALDPEGAERLLRLGTGPDRPASLQLDARSPLPYVLAGQGRMREALTELDWLDRQGGTSAMRARIVGATLLLGPSGTASPSQLLDSIYVSLDSAINADQARRTTADSVSAIQQACIAGLVAATLGKPTAEMWVRRLRTFRRHPHLDVQSASCAASILARVDLRAGRTAAAVDRLLAARSERIPTWEAEHLDRFLIAEILMELGKEAEAEGWYVSMAEQGLDELPLLAHSERRLAQLAERRGDHEAAAAHHRTTVRLWVRSDSALRSHFEVASQRRTPGIAAGPTSPPPGIRLARP